MIYNEYTSIFKFLTSKSLQETLGQGGSLEGWAEWLEGVADRVLGHAPREEYADAAKQFLLRYDMEFLVVKKSVGLTP